MADNPGQPGSNPLLRPGTSRRQRQSERRKKTRLRQLLFLPRLLVIAALALVTIIAPISGFVAANRYAAASAHVMSLNSGESWADTPQSQLSLDDDDALTSAPSSREIARLKQSAGECKFTDAGSGNQTVMEVDENTLIFPLPKGVFQQTSAFGYRIHPISGITRLHEGVDFSCASGTPIRALTTGTVISAAYADGCGYAVTLEHHIEGEHFYTRYCHMLSGSILVTQGQEVSPGTLLGSVGSTGNSTGPHLHFEVRPDSLDTPVDPINWLNQHSYIYYGEDPCS